MENIFLAQIKEVLEIDNREILLSDIFRDFDEWDSLSRLSLIAMLDDEYEVEIEEEMFKTLITIGDLYNEVTKRASK
jgi:acyl carrier protein